MGRSTYSVKGNLPISCEKNYLWFYRLSLPIFLLECAQLILRSRVYRPIALGTIFIKELQKLVKGYRVLSSSAAQ